MGIYYYERYIDTPIERTKKDKVLDILQSSMGFVSFAPYYIVAAFWSENFVKLSDKLLTYDEQAIALEYPRKDKHIFTYLFFVYTFIILSWESYYDVGNAILEGRSEGILEGISFMLRNVVPNANRVEERVIKYGLPFSNKKCRMDKIEMMLYFYHRRYSFTAAEFFELDMTIFLPIATVVMTYLTLIV
ncbi:uncharacterized protein LOC112459664 [Temnothorax curvispinosus]|uniref:Uncharacterized protein LOC112459664 n=1 Tax=Temnothorax curvispinosus TaxID=300111 RepID=A0A6J1QD42_9HYME|nr:uncharacterized protein LOC112459664 [Temnothorax curvispinosus]